MACGDEDLSLSSRVALGPQIGHLGNGTCIRKEECYLMTQHSLLVAQRKDMDWKDMTSSNRSTGYVDS